MPVRSDPLASLASWPVDIYLGGNTYEIPPLPAATWLRALLEDFGSLEPVIELFSIPAKAEIEQAIIEGELETEELRDALRDAIEVVAGRPWWVVLNYLNILSGFWTRFHGRILFGLDPERVSFGAYLDAAHYAFIENGDAAAVQKVNNFLESPPPGVTIELDEDAESDTFLAMLNQQR